MKNKILNLLVRRLNTSLAISLLAIFSVTGIAIASSTSTFNQSISTGTLATDIVDASWVTVGSPAITMSAITSGVTCQSSTGTFGTNGERIYVNNPDAADNGWTLTVAANGGATAVWDDSGDTDEMDFNDPTGSGCSDGADADDDSGQMTVDASVGTLNTGQCGSCNTTNITKGSSSAFSQGATDSITLLTAAAGSDDIGDWYITGISISQTVRAGQPGGSYALPMTLTATAS